MLCSLQVVLPFKLLNALLCFNECVTLFNNFVVDKEGLFGLLALLIKYSEVVPDLGNVSVEVRSFDKVFEGLLALALNVENYS